MDDDEFDFSGHELDDLPANALQELETTAIQATQHQANSHAPADGSDYGSDDGDEVINLDDAAGASRFNQLQQNHSYAPAHDSHSGFNHPHNELYGEPMEMEVEVEVEEAPRQSQADPNRMLRRIKDLELERRNLKLQLRTATDEANKKAGEADNLRRRAEAERRDAAQRLATVERQHHEAREQLKTENANVKRQLEATVTSNAFDRFDTVREEQERKTRRAIPTRNKTAATAIASPTATPKKAHRTRQGDGFDDDAPMLSPSKPREKLRPATPRHTHKRKRQQTNDSPIPALQLSESRERIQPPEHPPSAETKIDVALLRNLWKDDTRYALLQRLLAHRCSNGRDRVLEALSQHAFPSQPEKKLSSVVYDSLSSLRLSPSAQELALRICRVFFDLWAQCLREKHYPPVFLIIDALHFILAYEPASTAVATTEQIIPLIAESIYIVATPVGEAATLQRAEARAATLYSPQQRLLTSQVNLEDCLELLYLVATSCVSSPSPDALTRFWKTMPYRDVLLLLHRNQPLPQISLMLRILATSALPTSLGPLGIKTKSEAQDQAVTEANTIQRLTSMFSEKIEPIPDPDLPSPEIVPEAQIWKLRMRVLDVLTQFSLTDHGCARLAGDYYCIGRLIKYLNHCVASLYTQPLSPTQSLKIASINATTKLIHHIVTRTNTPVKTKLKGVQHAYHVAFSRITNSHRLVLEAGIEDWVIDMAHELLDEDVGPEEGDACEEVFPSGNSV
ncbi:hypothetical protein CC80DRAFT_497805 [Byssothecium circinans]|uniref:DNA repair protein Rad26 n=1 Tax=Byssothecium circinans TaxID=147558 RepID=A0A6A5TBD8_9PLEO|nr:hypothetical protein CC80DRAFT_497805 [Byssothecium circinans]